MLGFTQWMAHFLGRTPMGFSTAMAGFGGDTSLLGFREGMVYVWRSGRLGFTFTLAHFLLPFLLAHCSAFPSS